MIQKPRIPTEAFFLNFARVWFKQIAAGDWESAFAMLDLPSEFDGPYTPERYRRDIEDDHFCEGTRFRKQHPEGIVYSDPDTIGESAKADLYPPRPVQSEDYDYEVERDRCVRGGGSVELEHPVPLNGEWSDLTAGFDFLDRGDSYAVRLSWLHVL